MSRSHRQGQPGEDDYRFAVYPSRVRTALVTLGGLGFVALGVVLCLIGLHTQDPRSVPALITGVVSIPFFGLAAAFGLIRLISPQPAVVLDNTGLHDRASLTAAGFLPWREIDNVVCLCLGTQRMLSIGLTDPDAVLARATPLPRLAMRANMRLHGSPVAIPQIILPITVTQLKSEINATRSRSAAN